MRGLPPMPCDPSPAEARAVRSRARVGPGGFRPRRMGWSLGRVPKERWNEEDGWKEFVRRGTDGKIDASCCDSARSRISG